MANWYVSSVKWTAVTAWAALTSYSVGDLRRQNATPTVGNERVFRCTTAGTSGAVEPTWTVTKGGTTSDGTSVWTEVTGQAVYNGDGGGTAWAAPHARLANALATNWGDAGDTFYLDGGNAGENPHAETRTTAITLTFPGTPEYPNYVYSVDNSVVPPITLAEFASISATGTGTVNIGAGHVYVDGITFNSGSTSSNVVPVIGQTFSTASGLRLSNCKFKILSTAATSSIQLGPSTTSGSGADSLQLVNCEFVFSNAGQSINLGLSTIEMIGGTVAASGSVPSSLVKPSKACPLAIFRDVDLSNITGNLVSNNGAYGTNIVFQNCAVASGVVFLAGSLAANGLLTVIADNCDSGATNYREFKGNYSGTLTSETGVVADATDGGTRHSWKIVSNSGASAAFPFETKEIDLYNEIIGSVTASVEFTCNSQLTNNDLWVVFEYPSSASTPIFSFATTQLSNPLSGPSNYASGDAAWTSGLTYAQKASATFTVQSKGFIKARVYIAKPSTTLYIEPAVRLAGALSGWQAQIPGMCMVSIPAGGGLLIHPGMNGGIQ